MMSKAKWFAVRKPSKGEIIATSVNQIVPLKFRGPTNILYYRVLQNLCNTQAQSVEVPAVFGL